MNPIPTRVTEAATHLMGAANILPPWSIVPLAGDASARTYFRVIANAGRFVLMKMADTGFNSPAEEITKVSREIRELPFVDIQRYLSRKGVKVPAILSMDPERGALLLEDFGDRMLLDELAGASMTKVRDLYEVALDELAKIAEIRADDPRDSIAFARTFDRDLYDWEFMHFVEYALDHRIAEMMSEKDRSAIVGELTKLTGEYLSWESVFCHRDYHGRNLIVLEKGGLGVIDFQDALLGPLFYDLASLLRDSYFSLDEPIQSALVESYRGRLKGLGLRATGNRDEFRRAFDLMGLHRNLKAAGRFCYIDEVKGKPRYLADVPRTLAYVATTLNQYPELAGLRDVLSPLLPDVSEACRR